MLKSLIKDAGGWNAIRRAALALALKTLPGIYALGTLLTLIRFLPLAEYGQYGIAIAYVNLSAMCSWGLWSVSLVRALPGADREGVVGPVMWMMTGTALIASMLALVILPALQVSWQATLWVSGIVVAFVPRLLAYALAQADANGRAALWIDASYYLGSVSGFVILALLGRLHTVDDVMRILFTAAFISAVVALLNYGGMLRPRMHGKWRYVRQYGAWTGMQSLGEIYLQQGDVMLIGAMVDPVRLAPYIAARALIRLYAMLSQAVNFLLLPVASKLAAAGEYGRLRKKIRSALLSVWVILIPLNVILFLLADNLIPVILGEKYLAAIPFFKIVIGATFFEPVQSVLANALIGIGKARKVAMLVWSLLGLNVMANVVLVQLYEMDAVPWILVATYACLSLGFVLLSRKELSSSHPQTNTRQT
jgi:O-antigen/teichoic acid export membrane protein